MRERIMLATIDEMNERGSKFTMDDLAYRLGVSKRTIYENFSSKGDLIGAVINLFIEKIEEKDNEIINDKSLSSIEKLKRFALVIRDELKYINERTIYEAERYFPKHWKKIDRWMQERATIQKEVIKEGIEKGEIRDINPDILIKMLNEAKNWILDHKFLQEQKISMFDAAGSFFDIILFGVAKK